MRTPGRRKGADATCGDRNLGEVLQFMRLIWGVSHGLQSTSKRMENTLGVTGPQRLVVRIVGRCPGISAGDLARTLRIHPSTVTGVVRRLEERRLLQRKPDARDARQVHFRLTAAGRRLDRLDSGTVEAAVRDVLSRLPKRRIRDAAVVLAELERALTGAVDQPASPARKRP